MRVVLDASVVVSGICWDGEAYHCLVEVARRQVAAYASAETFGECHDVVRRVMPEARHPGRAAARWLWFARTVKIVDAVALGKQRSRDPKDDPYLAAALSAHARFIVTYDKDLLALRKPFGIEIIRPSQLLRTIK